MKSTTFIAGTLLAIGLAVTSYAPSAQAQTPTLAEWQTGWATYQAIEAVPLAARGWVTASQDFSTVINVRREEVFEVYANVDNSMGRHPFLQSITHFSDTWQCSVLTRDFTAIEILTFPLPDGTFLPLTLNTISQQRIHPHEFYYDSDTFDIQGVITHQHVTFEEAGHGATRVTEHLTFETPATVPGLGSILGLAVGGGVFAHQLVANSLKAALESGQLGNDHGNGDADGAYLRAPHHDGQDFGCSDHDDN